MQFRRREDRIKRRLRSEQPISRLLPNMITIAGMCCGLSAIRFAMAGRWELAAGFILAAALIDGMDGRVARMLGATSNFGAQLDSLSDFVCFGVAPAMVMYMWLLQDVRGLGWAVVLFFSVCTALRLARFNTALYDDKQEPWKKQFFIGVPSPAGGLLCLLPLFIALQTDQQIVLPAGVVVLHMLVVGTLMASRIPTYSGKQVKIRHETIPHFMLAGSLLLVLFIIEPWLSIVLLSVAYLVSVVFSVRHWRALSAATPQTDA
jgi:CDP-diacylglycerol--serine O-phosphatidyltransferase